MQREVHKKENMISDLKKQLRAKETQMCCWEEWIGN
jgi:hypothetical protein